MKKLLAVFILLSALFLADKSLAQGFINIDSIKVKTSSLPGNPLYITAMVRTSSSHAVKLNNSFLIRNDTVFLSGCYYSGPLATPALVRDTFRIGALNPGTYTIHFRAFRSGNFNFCDSSSSQVKTQTFSVNSPLGIKQPENLATPVLFPNPVKDELWVQGTLPKTISVYNLLGLEIKEAHFIDETMATINLGALPKGVYTVEILGKDGRLFRRKVLKE